MTSEELETIGGPIADAIEAMLPPGVGYALTLAHYKPDQRKSTCAFATNIEPLYRIIDILRDAASAAEASLTERN